MSDAADDTGVPKGDVKQMVRLIMNRGMPFNQGTVFRDIAIGYHGVDIHDLAEAIRVVWLEMGPRLQSADSTVGQSGAKDGPMFVLTGIEPNTRQQTLEALRELADIDPAWKGVHRGDSIE